MKWARGLIVASAIAAGPAFAEQQGNATALQSPDDWYDCAAFYFLAAVFAEGDAELEDRMIVMSAVAKTKGEELARGSDAVPPLEALSSQGPDRGPGAERVRYFLEEHKKRVQGGEDSAAANATRYMARCNDPVLDVVKQMKDRRDSKQRGVK